MLVLVIVSIDSVLLRKVVHLSFLVCLTIISSARETWPAG